MFELIFGIVWTLFTSIFIFFFLIFPLLTGEGIGFFFFFPGIFLIIFTVIGISFIIKGAKKIHKNKQTEERGEECYGRVIEVKPTGSYVNNQQLYKVLVAIYNPYEDKIDSFWEDIGFDKNKFEIGSFIKVLYYNGDINFMEDSRVVDDMPESTKQFILDQTKDIDLEPSDDDYIIKDGVKYIREDAIHKYL